MRRLAGLSLVVLAVLALQVFWAPRHAEAAKFKTLYDFCVKVENSICVDGRLPSSSLVEYSGNFYGVTAYGGQTDQGTIFKITPAGVFKQLHTFCTVFLKCTDGRVPGDHLILGPPGYFYGVTTSGDNDTDQGTVFKVSTTGTLTTLHAFCAKAACTDGSQPVSVVMDGKGDLYGTTLVGGGHREGTVFKISSTGVFTKLHDFCSEANCSDGMQPGPLMLGKDGDLYGTTPMGGARAGGIVYKISQTGAFKVIYDFCSLGNCKDSEQPWGPLTEAAEGIFYGTSQDRTALNYKGAVFRITKTGNLHVIYGFCSGTNCVDGGAPLGGLTFAPDRSFYGAASSNGKFFNGLLFNVTSTGTYKVVYNFCSLGGCYDGATPSSKPIFGTDGNLYGTTAHGGSHNNGTIYRLMP